MLVDPLESRIELLTAREVDLLNRLAGVRDRVHQVPLLRFQEVAAPGHFFVFLASQDVDRPKTLDLALDRLVRLLRIPECFRRNLRRSACGDPGDRLA